MSQRITIDQGESVYSTYDLGSLIPGIYIIALMENDKLLGTSRVVKKQLKINISSVALGKRRLCY